jgi:hypothetical protein
MREDDWGEVEEAVVAVEAGRNGRACFLVGALLPYLKAELAVFKRFVSHRLPADNARKWRRLRYWRQQRQAYIGGLERVSENDAAGCGGAADGD